MISILRCYLDPWVDLEGLTISGLDVTGNAAICVQFECKSLTPPSVNGRGTLLCPKAFCGIGAQW
jgi:hypothetical protein